MEETPQESRVLTVLYADWYLSTLADYPLLPLGGKPVVEQVLQRIRKARFGQRLVLITNHDNQALRAICEKQAVPYHVTNMLDPMAIVPEIATAWGADIIVRCMANQPLLSPRMLDACGQYALDSGMDYITVGKMPYGVSAEAFPLRSLQPISKFIASLPRPFAKPAFQSVPEFDAAFLPAPLSLRGPALRLTIETAQDYRIFRQIWEEVTLREEGLIPVEAVLTYLEEHPELRQFLQLTHAIAYAA